MAGMLICYCYEYVQIKYQRQNKTNMLSISRTNLMAASIVNFPDRIGKLESSISWMKFITAESRTFFKSVLSRNGEMDTFFLNIEKCES